MAVLALTTIKRYWPIFVVALLVLGVYTKGRIDANRAHDAKELKAVADTAGELVKTMEHTHSIKEKIHNSRTTPDDKRDSCLLSTDPFSSHCL